MIRIAKGQKAQFEETEQESEPDMAGMLELSDWRFKTTLITMLRALMGRQHVKTDGQCKRRTFTMLEVK